MILLEDYGWNTFHQQNYIKSENSDKPIARVTSLQGFKYHLITANGEIEAELAGRLLFGADTEDLPKVGDWVCYLDYGTSGYIVERLPRQNALSRKTPGKKTERQILGANIDYACIVQGLDRDFNIARLERYLAQIIACGIQPIIVMNKLDLVSDISEFVAAIKGLNRECLVFFCSIQTGQGIHDLRASLQKGKTYMLLGSSGVGKSSLLNGFMNSAVQPTGAVSDFNSKGKHTTTARELFVLPNGSLLIDTPGMREFGMTSEDGSSEVAFPLIDALATSCRFADCKHVNEAGCAVLDALQTGELESSVYNSYIKLVKEQRRFEINAEDKKRLGKQSGKMSREANAYRKKYKF